MKSDMVSLRIALILGIVSQVLANNSTNQKVSVTVINDWTGRFQGDIKFPITEEVIGWEVLLTCTGALTKIDEWMGDIINHTADNHMYTLVNKQHTGILHPGDNLDIQLFGKQVGSSRDDTCCICT